MVARSSIVAKFVAIALGICELIWLKRLLGELRVITTNSMLLYCDSKVAISIVHNPIHHDRTKHVEVDHRFIKEKMKEGMLNIDYRLTREQTTNILAK